MFRRVHSAAVAVAVLMAALGSQSSSAMAKTGADPFYGEFTTQVAFDTPAFHGIEPKIALTYSSGGGSGFAGMGFALSGASMIERASKGRGAPAYTTADIYLMDGMELVPCAGVTSPGCTAGGTHTTKTELYVKIVFNSTANTWTVWQKNGARIEYTSLFSTSGGTFRWGQKYNIDPSGNTVTYNYWCDPALACYLNTITYNGNTITFYRETRTDIDSYATGRSIGQVRYRLKSIDVKVGTLRHSAYKITYGTHASTSNSYITSIQRYGKDAVVDAAGVISGGTTQPANSFTWSLPSAAFAAETLLGSRTYGVANSGQDRSFVDLNGDGRADYVYRRDSQRELRAKLSNGTTLGTETLWATTTYDAAASGDDRWYMDLNNDGKADMLYRRDSTQELRGRLSTGTAFGAETVWGTRTYSAGNNNKRRWLVDVNGDGIADFVYRRDGNQEMRVMLGTGTAFGSDLAWGSNTYGAGDDGAALELADMNGDGKADVVYQRDGQHEMRVRLSSGTTFGTDTLWGSKLYGVGNNGGGRDHVDINGDGKADFAYQRDGNNEMRVMLSTGSSFAADTLWGTKLYGVGASGNARAFVDVNADGTNDFIYQRDGQNDIRVMLSTGTGFKTDTLWGSKVYGVGADGNARDYRDVKGVGKMGYLYQRSSSNELRGLLPTGANALVITGVTNPLGGTTTITYGPSSAYANTNGPAVRQVVTQLVESDGRGTSSTTTFTYSGGLYDYYDHRFLGFRYVKETRPCITGEASCPYQETWFKQDYGSESKAETIYFKDGAGKLLLATTSTYTTNGATVPYTSLETTRWQYAYDGSGTACSAWPCTYGRRSRLTRTFDAYGNITSETSYGDNEVSGDETHTATNYYVNSSAYLMGYPALVRVYKGTSTAGTKVSESRLLYDQTASYTTAPTKGLLRQQQRWLSSTGAFLTTSLTYDAYGNVLTETDPMGAVTTTTYDATYHLYPVTKKDALLRSITSVYDVACGKPTSVTQPDARVTTITYDALCRDVQVTAPGGSYTKHTYVSIGVAGSQYIQVATPGPGTSGDLWTRQYLDGMGRTWRELSRGPASGQEIRVDKVYDSRGNVWKTSLPYFANGTAKWIVATFDTSDRTTRLTNPDNTYSSTSYALGSSTTTNELGRWLTEYRNGLGQVTERREKLGASYVRTTYTYDVYGNVATITDHAGKVWTFIGDSLGRRTSVVDPDTGTWSYTYDAGSRELSRTDGKGQKTEHTYDALGRTKTRVYKSSAGAVLETVTYTYDQVRTGYYNIGKLTTLADAQGSQTLDYDIAGNMVKGVRVVGSTSYTFTKGYDSGARLLWTTYPDADTIGTAASPLTYDTAGRLKSIPGYVNAVSYDAAGNATSITMANGTVTTRTYNANRGWLTNLNTVMGATVLQNLSYTRNNGGQITALGSAFANEGWSYAYDDLGRLTTATNTSSSTYSQTIAYAANGNISSNSRLGTYTYGTKPHAVTAAGSNAYAYDSNGNMTSGAGRTITWDAANRPTNVNGALYYYTGDGERVKKVEGGTTTIYIGDYEIAGTTVTKHVFLGGTLVAKKVGATKYWLHADHLGSVQSVTNSSGAEVQRIKYRPFGERLSASTSHVQTRGFTGQTEDASGLVYLNARYYDPMLGRFIAADPTMPSEGSQGLNRYSYANNDPVNNSDIDGLGLFSSVKSAFKKAGKFLKRVGLKLQKWSAYAAKLPVLGGLLAMAMNTVGALLQGDWTSFLRGAATIAVMVGTMIASAGIGGMALGFLARVAAQAALGGASGYLIARINGATHAEALKAGILGAKMGAAMEAFSSFMEVAAPKVMEYGTGMKPDRGAEQGYCTAYDDRLKVMDKVGEWLGDKEMFYEKGRFGQMMGQGAMRGQSKLFTFLHDNVMEFVAPSFYDGNMFVPEAAANGLQLFMVEIPLNFGSMKLIEQGFKLAGEKLQSRLSASGQGTLGFLANGTLNPSWAMSQAAIYGGTMEYIREMKAAAKKAAGGAP